MRFDVQVHDPQGFAAALETPVFALSP
jgi:hypothetical protein